MHIFTSVAANYLPKAGVLASSLKRFHPGAHFHLILSDDLPSSPNRWSSCFDTIINIRELPINNRQSWIFKHRLLELCTAVKGTAFQYIADRFGAERIYYFDPDIVILNALDRLDERLSRHSILLIPHQTEPERDPMAVLDNEIVSLRHGVYNLGFLGARLTAQGRRIIDWWANRLIDYCYDEVGSGLFTDQKWMDLAPALFDDVGIVRDPEYNVATWNLTHRQATGRVPDNVLVNGKPLVFYHFSGFDRGAYLATLERYGKHSPVLFELRDWYLAECEGYGQSILKNKECVYARYDNGRLITDHQRWVYRNDQDLSQEFPNPFSTTPITRSYYHWYQYYYRSMNTVLLRWLRRNSHHKPIQWGRDVWRQCRQSLKNRLVSNPEAKKQGFLSSDDPR
jgi:lipopolysaccharide biosynthesis glycosyltransferase